MSGQLGDLVVSISADMARFREDMGKANKITQDTMGRMHSDITGGIKGIEGAFKTVGGIIGGVTAALAGGAMFGNMINTTKEVAGEILKLTKSLGITAEEASVMRVALDDVFLTADDLTGASSRITKQLVKNEEAFKSLGVATRDGNGNFRSTVDIMTETNSKLLEFREGTDRNVEGVKIYGKGWEEARKILKLTAEGMVEAKQRAEDLHLIFGASGLEQVKAYKLAMKDIGDVTESLKVQIGMALIPELTRLGVAIGETSVKGIPSFISGLHSIEAEMMRLAMLADKAGGSITTVGYYLTGGKFTDTGKWWKEQNDLYKARYDQTEKDMQALANLEVGLDANGNPFKAKSEKAKSDKRSTSGGVKTGAAAKIQEGKDLATAYKKQAQELFTAVLEIHDAYAAGIQGEGSAFNMMATQGGDLKTDRYNVTPLSKYHLMTNDQYSIPQSSASQTEIDAATKEKAELLNIEENFNQQMLSSRMALASQSLAIIQQAAGDNKAVAIGVLVGQKAIAAAQIMINTEVALTGIEAAYAWMGPAGDVMILAQQAQIRTQEMMSLGILAAATVVEGIQIAGKKATGGPVASGSTYLVGERGPELFTPGASGMITPNDRIGGGVMFAPVYNIDARNSTLSALEIEGIIKRSTERSKAEIMNNMNRGGSFAIASGRR